MTAIPIDSARSLAAAALERAGTSPENAASVAEALVAAERDAIASHGLSRVAFYADQVAAGKVAGQATPAVDPRGAVVRVDAGTGFAYPALDAGIQPLITQAQRYGIAAVAITNSHHFGVAGHFVERLAEQGLVGLGFGNAPAAIAPWGGNRPLFGTDPIAFAAPRGDAPPLVVDLSVSRVARGKIMMAQRRGDPIPEGWAIDAEGRPTTDADAAMTGSVLPMGEAKGAALALMVELLAAGLTGSSFAYEASSLFDAEGPAPRLGQLFIAIDPAFFQAGAGFGDRVDAMCAMIADQPDARLPGARRLAARDDAQTQIDVGEAILADLQRRAGHTDPGGS